MKNIFFLPCLSARFPRKLFPIITPTQNRLFEASVMCGERFHSVVADLIVTFLKYRVDL